MLLNRVGGSIITQGGGGNLEFPPEPYVGRLYYKPDGSRYDDIKRVLNETEFRFDLRHDTGLTGVTWITSDAQGNLYCATSVNGVITKLTPDLEAISKITTAYKNIGFIYIDLDGNFYITSPAPPSCIAKVRPDGSTVWELPTEGSNPRILGLDKNNCALYVFGRTKNFEKVDLDGNVLFAGYEGLNSLSFYPLAFEICEKGDISYVPYNLKDTIYVYSAENELVSSKKMPFTYISDIKHIGDYIFVCSDTAMAACNANWQVESQVSYTTATSCYLKMFYMDKLNTFVLLGKSYYGLMIKANWSESGRVSLQLLFNAKEYYFGNMFNALSYLSIPIHCQANDAVYMAESVPNTNPTICGISRMPMNAKLMGL